MRASDIIEITDFQAPELDVYARLSENQLLNRCEPEKGMFIAESPRVIERALDAGYRPEMCIRDSHRTCESSFGNRRSGASVYYSGKSIR